MFGLHAAQTERFPFLLESRQANASIGRYSLLLGDCGEELICRTAADLPAFYARLGELGSAKSAQDSPFLPFRGGWFVYLAYEAGQAMQPHLPTPAEGLLAFAAYCRSAVIVDHVEHKSWVISETQGRAQTLKDQLGQLPCVSDSALKIHFSSSDGEWFEQAVERVVDYIAAGDVYQANLSRRWSAAGVSRRQLLQAYAQLRERNPACFAASIQSDHLSLASASPERLFCLKDGVIETRPIAGTRPRGADAAADRQLMEELRAHPKEQAEHIMLVDLERNDLGRLCEAGSVQVDELLAMETYASVHHIVSNVRGLLRPETSLETILKAVFPGGTITGCPKIRCMQIIAELEQKVRGAYTGSLGYISNDGNMDFNILIRTLALNEGQLTLDAGAGIVADSDPARERAETEVKAAGVLRAL